MGKPAGRKSNYLIRILMSVLTIILIVLFLDIMSLVVDIQGTARVVNYAGLVRGTTQRIIKLEDAQIPQDKLISAVDSYIDGLRFGSDKLDLVRLDDDAFQGKMTELDRDFDELVQDIADVRSVGFENTDIIERSEAFFAVCDDATSLAEAYSQQKASALRQLENVVIVDIAGLIVIIGIELFRAVRFAAQNRVLQKKVYIDEATGLPNKNKCEELLDDPSPIPRAAPVAVCVFDLNNLRTINNNLGHEKGDEYIRSFAKQLGEAAIGTCFAGRDGGDEFIAILRDADEDAVRAWLGVVRQACRDYSKERPDMPISYAVGWALSSDFDSCTMRDLFRRADRNMYIDKNRAKMEEAAEKQRASRRVIKQIEQLGYRFSDCLLCDAKLDQYRTLRASSDMFLAEEGSFSGAVEQIAREVESAGGGDIANVLSLGNLRSSLTEQGSAIEIPYRRRDHRGRMTVVFIDGDGGVLHHFVLGFEPFAAAGANERHQLSRYYDQMRQSILENSNYIDALLESTEAAYSVDVTHGLIERVFMHPDGTFRDLGIDAPYPYRDYCAHRSAYVLPETLENYRIVDTPEKLLRRFEAGAREITVEYQERDTDDSPIWLQKNILMSRDTVFDPETETETPIVRGVILIKNSSEFHEHERREKERLEEALQSADSQNRAKTEFMNRMSHDFRTPINGIMGMLEIARRTGEDNPEKTRECLDKIQVSARHLLDLVNDVLDMNKLESGKMALEHEPFDLLDVLDEVRLLVDAQLRETGITHTARRGRLPHTHFVGSALRVRQITLNLFSNAIKYNKPHGTIETSVREASCDGKVAVLELTISDTGIGMSEDFVETKLFTPFSQELASPRTNYNGTGLGMSIVKALLDQMGGDIAVESTLGEGTAFTFHLPLEIDESAAEATAEDERDLAAPASDSLAGAHVLLVEDNEINMEIAEFYLVSAGATVDKAWNGREAVDAFAASKVGSYTVVLMDLMMPEMDGLEATRTIRQMDRPDAKTTPIVAMTANAFDEDREKTRAAGMDAHLTKPLDMRTLYETIESLAR